MSSTRNSPARRSAGTRGAAESPGRAAPPRRPRRRAGEADDAGFLSLTPELARTLLFVAARTTTTALVVVAALVLVVLLSADGGMDGISGAIAASWLAAHQVPLVIGKTALGLLPLLPTLLLLWSTARDCARAVEPDSTRADLARLVAAALAGPLLVTAVCLAVAEDASAVVALQPPNSLAAFAWVIVLYAAAAGIGIATRSPAALAGLPALPEWAIAGLHGAGRTVLRLLGCATAVTLLSLLGHWSRLGDTYATAGGAVGFLGLTLLSLGYLPNLVVGGVSVLVGSGFEVGDASVGLFSVVGGPVPAVPLIAAIPPGPAAGWWPVLLLVPAAVGVLGGLDTARTSHDRPRTPWATLTSAAAATSALLLLAAVASGELGSFGRVGVDLPIFAVVCFAWLAAAGYAGLVFARRFLVPVGGVRTRRPARGSAPDDDHDDHEAAGYHDDGYHDDGYHDEDYHDEDDHYRDDEGRYRPEDDDYESDHYDDYDDEYETDDHDDLYGEDADHDDYDPRDGRDRDYDDRSRGYDARDDDDHFAAATRDRADSYLEDDDREIVVGELIEDDEFPARIRPARGAQAPEIVDAEVVETDADVRERRRRR
ncbi:cell division protein PerM [Nocardia takedensis]